MPTQQAKYNFSGLKELETTKAKAALNFSGLEKLEAPVLERETAEVLPEPQVSRAGLATGGEQDSRPLLEDIKQGFQSLVTGLGKIPRIIPLLDPSRPLKKVMLPEVVKQEDKKMADISSNIQQWAERTIEVEPETGRLSKPPENFIDYVEPRRLFKVAAENIPLMGAFIATTIANPVAGAALMFGVEGGSTKESLDNLKAQGMEVDPIYEDTVPIIVGALNAALERTGINRILKVAKVPGLKTRILQVVTASFVEGGTEGLQEVNQVLAEAGVTKSITRRDFDRIKESIYAGTVLGLVGGTVSGVVGSKRTEEATEPEQLVQKIVENNQLSDLTERLGKEELQKAKSELDLMTESQRLASEALKEVKTEKVTPKPVEKPEKAAEPVIKKPKAKPPEEIPEAKPVSEVLKSLKEEAKKHKSVKEFEEFIFSRSETKDPITGKFELNSKPFEKELSELSKQAKILVNKGLPRQEANNKVLTDFFNKANKVKPEVPKPEKPKAAPKKLGVAKEPWEMTRKEFEIKTRAQEGIQAAFKFKGEIIRTGTIHDYNKLPNKALGVDSKFLETGFVGKDGKFFTLKEAPIKRTRHKEIVKHAISEGKPVPEEVLKEYPDLAQKKAAPKVTEPKVEVKKPEPVAVKPTPPETVSESNILKYLEKERGILQITEKFGDKGKAILKKLSKGGKVEVIQKEGGIVYKSKEIEKAKKPTQKITKEEGHINDKGELIVGGKVSFSYGAAPPKFPAPNVSRAKLNEIVRAEKRQKRKKLTKAQQDIENAPTAIEKVKELMRERRAQIDLGAYDTNLYVHKLNQRTTERERELLPFLLEKTDIPKKLNRPDLEKLYSEKGKDPRLIQEAKDIKQRFDNAWEFMQKNMPEISSEQIENYVTHIWDVSGKQKKAVTNWFTTRNRFLKQRYIETLKEGIDEFGLKPRYLDVGEIIKIHDAVMNRAVSNRKFIDRIKQLEESGLPLIARIDQAPQDWVMIDHPAIRQSLIKPGEIKQGEKVTAELQNLLAELGIRIGRRLSPTVFGRPNIKQGQYKTGEPPQIQLQRYFKTKTLAHEIGHHLDKTLGLGDKFVEKHRDEILRLNTDRIEKMKEIGKKEYAESNEEMIAELFAHVFVKPERAMTLAPSASSEVLALLRKDGNLTKLIDFDFESRGKILVEEQLNTMLKLPVKVHPDIAKPLKVIFDSRVDGNVVAAYEGINAFLKKTWLSVSLFHHLALTETSVGNVGLRRTLRVWNPVNIYKGLVRNDFDVYKRQELAKDAIEHNLQLGASIDIPVHRIQQALDTLKRRTENVPLVNRTTKLLASFNEQWDKALWDYMHDTFKLQGYEHLVSKLDPAKITDIKKAKREMAQFVNDTYGGQNWDLLFVNPKTVQMLGWGLLSPDWTYSTLRQALAPTGIGKIYNETKGLRQKAGAMFWLKAALYFGVGINALNALYRKKDMEENPELYDKKNKWQWWDYTMVGNVPGHNTHLFVGRFDTGEERYIRWGKQFRELPEMFIDEGEFNPVTASIKKMGGKTAPSAQLISQIATGVSPSGFTNKDIYGKRGFERLIGIAKTLARSPVPFSQRSVFSKIPGIKHLFTDYEQTKEFYYTDLAMPSSKGMTKYKARKLFKIAINRRDERMITETFQQVLRNKLDSYELFNAALTEVKSDHTKEVKELFTSMDEAKKLFKQSTGRQRNVLKRQIKKMEKEIERFKKGGEVLSGSLEKYEDYLISTGKMQEHERKHSKKKQPQLSSRRRESRTRTTRPRSINP